MHKKKHDCTKLLLVTRFFILKFTSRNKQMQKCEFANCWVNRVHHCSSLEIGIDVSIYAHPLSKFQIQFDILI